jgi:hypothetical protein
MAFDLKLAAANLDWATEHVLVAETSRDFNSGVEANLQAAPVEQFRENHDIV